MAEYIEREAVVNLILETPFTMSMCLSEQECHGMKRAQQILARLAEETLPAADVAPVRHGRWERKKDPYEFFDTIPVCSVCGCTTKWREEYLFCPNCGARLDMEGEE